MQNTINSPEEINFFELFQQLKKNKMYIYYFTTIITLIAILYSFLSTPLYKSYISIYPYRTENPLNSQLGDIQGVASAFGFNIDGNKQVSFNIPDVVNSRRLRKGILSNKWMSELYDQQIDLITYWEINDSTKILARIKKVIGYIFPSKYKIDSNNIYFGAALEELEDRITIEEKDSGLNVIMVYMEEPILSADIANYISQFIRRYISDEMEIQSKKYRQFIEERLKIAEYDLKRSEDKLTEFRKTHPKTLEPPEIQIQRARLVRNIYVNQEVYITLRQQYELAKIDELKELPIINVIDAAEPPTDRDSPKRLMIILSSIFSGLFLSTLWILFRISVNKPKHIPNKVII